jgi:hypothetical protein
MENYVKLRFVEMLRKAMSRLANQTANPLNVIVINGRQIDTQ